MVGSIQAELPPACKNGLPASLVRMLTSRRVQGLVFFMWLLIALCGARLIKPFMSNCSNTFPGPTGSPSRVARDEFDRSFPPQQPVMLTVLVTSADGMTPLINRSAHFPFFNESVDTPLSAAAANVSHALRDRSLAIARDCEVSFSSFWDIGQEPNASDGALKRGEKKLLDSALAYYAEGMLFNDKATSTLMIASIKTCHGKRVDMFCATHAAYCAPIVDLGASLKAYAASHEHAGELRLQVTDFPDINTAIHDGIKKTLDLSTMSLPLALAVLAVMLRNFRLLICPLLCILCTIAGAILVMFPISLAMNVSSQAPSLMVATALAMSVDYSLFLLSRFSEEIALGRPPARAVEVTLATSGHTVLVSGGALTLCFLGMLIMPINVIQTMGLSAAVTTVFAMSLALTLTPTLLLAAPRFFTASRRFGLTLDGLCCGRHQCDTAAPAEPAPGVAAGDGLGASLLEPDAVGAPSVAPADAATPVVALTPERPVQVVRGAHKGCWPRVGRCAQRWAALVVVVIVGVAVPCGLAVARLGYVEGLLPMMPASDPATTAFVSLQQQFGVGTVFSNTLLLRPPAGVNATDPAWLAAACAALRHVAGNVTADLAAQGTPYDMEASAFSGLMIQRGKCTSELLALVEDAAAKWPELGAAEGKLYDMFTNAARDATKVGVTLKENPFDTAGQAWVRAMRHAMTAVGTEAGLGELYLTGVGPEQMDGAAETFGSLPKMVAVTLAIVCAVLGVAFRSVLVPSARRKQRPSLQRAAPLAVQSPSRADTDRPMGRSALLNCSEAAKEASPCTGLAPEPPSNRIREFPRRLCSSGAAMGPCPRLPPPPAPRAAQVPVRSVICLAWMLCIVFGAAVGVYQLGLLQWLGYAPLQPSGGDLFWMSPCIAFAIVVGLGLDYDVFFMESVVEQHDLGFTSKQSVVNALAHTGNTICAAGIIMALAFGALLVGTMPALNQIGFLLVIGVLVDCFVTTKLVIPALMALIPDRANLWPRQRPSGKLEQPVEEAAVVPSQ